MRLSVLQLAWDEDIPVTSEALSLDTNCVSAEEISDVPAVVRSVYVATEEMIGRLVLSDP